MSEVKIAELEQYKEGQKTLVALRDAAVRLATNKDFKLLILDGFCTTEAARYVQESGDPMLTPAMREDALNIAQASGHLKRFLQITIAIGDTAGRNVDGADVEIDNLREFGDEE